MKCPVCGTNNSPGETFCSNCGAYLDPAGTSASQTIVSNVAGSTSTAGTSSQATLSGSGGTGATSTLAPGSRLQNGRYVIEKVLGQGGMGAALLAKDTRVSNKLVVIKELISDNTDPAKRQEDVRNFEREVATLAQIDHPLVPSVTDSFQEGTRYFMVQEYVPGENLEDRMERVKQPMPEREALTYASQILDVLDYLENQNPPIVHRDIKPANIIIGSKDKRAHLVDFGIARADENKNSRRKQTSALGTPGYAPPEQYQGNADTRSDLYALAATLHHILTNRDPRNYPPFAYPAVRTLNPQLSPEIERVLNRALTIDINKRYQNAASMKHDIDEILQRRFGTSGDITGMYTLNTSGPISTPGITATTPAAPPTQAVATQRPSNPPTPLPSTRSAYAPPPPPARPMTPPPVGPYPAQQPQQVGMFTPQRQRRQGGTNWVGCSFALLILVVVVIAALLFLPSLLSSRQRGTTGSTGATPTTATTASPTFTIPANGIGVNMINGEAIGISNGSAALDTSLPDASLKQQAATAFKDGNLAQAQALWLSATQKVTNDAEALIYLEDLKVANAPHVTFVVATMLSGNNAAAVGTGESDLQGAYVAQKEFNDNAKLSGGLKVYLLIANSGSSGNYTADVARQIVQLAKSDKTVVGVIGWPYSNDAYTANQILGQAGIPMVSQTASSDALTGLPNFFRVNPSNKSEAIAGAKYAEQVLHARNVAVFYDPANLYTQNLQQDFINQFTADGNTAVATEQYTVGNASSIGTALQDALSKNPDLIYFAGYSNDATTLLQDMQNDNAPANLQVLGGDALYELSGYPQSVRSMLPRLHFTSFFYPDEWGILGLASKEPAFFKEYPADFNPNNQAHSNPYGYTRPTNDAALSYDATLAMLQAVNNAYTAGNTTLTPSALLQGLQQINTSHPLQGVSGQIAFGSDGNPINKAVVILYFNSQDFIQMDTHIEGIFLAS
jgi:serine/threonine protein kinase/ABC-type branched-subunit amino acid transport system substrate-binding protein